MPKGVRVGRGSDLGDRTYFFEIIPDLLVISGFDGYVRDVNTSWQQVVGWSRKELLAIPFLEFIHPEDRMRMASELEGVSKGIFMMFLESRFQCKDGSYKWFMWKAAGVPGRSKVYMLGRELQPADGPSPARLGATDAAVARRARHLDMVQSWTQAGSWEVDLATMRFWWSAQLARILGYDADPGPEAAKQATALVAPEDRDRLVAALGEALEHGRAELACTAIRHDGQALAVRCLVEAVRDSNGVATALAGVVLPAAPGPDAGPTGEPFVSPTREPAGQSGMAPAAQRAPGAASVPPGPQGRGGRMSQGSAGVAGAGRGNG